MDRMSEEITLEPIVTQNQDDKTLNNEEFHHKSDGMQNQREKHCVFIRIFNSKKYLKQFLLWIVLFICVILIAGPLSLHISYTLPSVKPRSTAAHIFSEERARDYLINLTFYGPRVINTRGNFYARNYLISQIERIYSMNKRNLRFEVDLQNFTDSNHNQLQNIVVRISNPDTNSKNVSSLMLSAHYDTVEFSSGSSDDGSGVVILLELLSNLVNDLRMNFSDIHLIILFSDGEEADLLGAQAFITNHIWRSNIHRFIYIDAASCNEEATLIQIKSSQLIVDYSRVTRPSANFILGNIPNWIGLSSDYNIYSLNGSLLGYDFGFVLDGYTYHTQLDHLLFIKQGVIQDLGENLGILIRNILLGDFEKIENIIDNDPFIYFDIFRRYLIMYKMSTSRILQELLIILIMIIGIILIIIDDIYHRQRSFECIDFCCIYFDFKYPFLLRIISIIIYFISHIISIFVGLGFSMIIALIMSKIRPLSWFGNSTLAIFLFSLPYLIGFIIVTYIWNIFHCFILKKWPKNSSRFNSTIEVNFDFEQNFSILLIYIVFMIISIVSNNRLFYIVLVWSIFICPIYLILMIIQFILHWKNLNLNFFEEKYHWLYFPLIISLFPLIHTIEITNRLLRILIPFLARKFSSGWSLRGNIIICSISCFHSIFFLLIFIPMLQRIKCFCRILIILCITFLIIFIIAYNRQPFTTIHPYIYYARHMSKSIYKVDKSVSLVLQSSSIRVTAYDNLALSPVLDHFSAKSGYILYNKNCSKPTICTFDDTFNRTIAVQHVEVESTDDFLNYTIIVRHVLSYNIRISSFSFGNFTVRNQWNIPRTETIIDVKSVLSNIHIRIRRCDLIDSPFLLLFNRLMPNFVLMGASQCQAIVDDTILIIELNRSSIQ